MTVIRDLPIKVPGIMVMTAMVMFMVRTRKKMRRGMEDMDAVEVDIQYFASCSCCSCDVRQCGMWSCFYLKGWPQG